jgi:hypothetical protein
MHQDTARPIWREHMGLLASASLAGIVILRLLGVANWDLTTALAIADVAGTTSVTLNSILASLPTILTMGLTTALLPAWVRLRRRSSVERWAALSASSLPLLLVVALAPLTVLLAAATVVLLTVAVKRMAKQRNAPKGPKRAAADQASPFEQRAAWAGMIALVVATTSTTPWLPTETISVDGAPSFVGYVVGVRDIETVVLTHSGRKLEVFPTASMERAYCTPDSAWAKSALQLAMPPRYEACS